MTRFAMLSTCLIALAVIGCGTSSTTDRDVATAPPRTSAPVQPTPAITEPPIASQVVIAPTAPELPRVEPAPSPAAATVREPSILLSSRKKDVLIVAVDFAFSPAMNAKSPLDERRQYVASQIVSLYAKDFARKEKAGQKVKVFAYSVPNADDYARGDFRNISELAIFETTQDLLKDEAKSALERLGTIEWRAVLK